MPLGRGATVCLRRRGRERGHEDECGTHGGVEQVALERGEGARHRESPLGGGAPTGEPCRWEGVR
eukprot:6936956-Prymnesium_polylepis.1